MQCSPWAIGLVILVVAGLILRHQLHAHWTGIVQAVAGAGSALACLAAGGLVYAAMRLVDSTLVPHADHADVFQPWDGREPAVITAMTLRPEDRAEMEAEAAMLAGDDTTLVVSERGALYGLQDEPEDAP